jgi:hypothetical protein
MITKAEREADRAICEAATPGPWQVSPTSNVWGPQHVRLPIHDQIADVDPLDETGRRHEDAEAIVNAVNRLPAYIDAAEEMERRIAKIEDMATGWAGSAETYTIKGKHEEAAICRAKAKSLHDVLCILRGEP